LEDHGEAAVCKIDVTVDKAEQVGETQALRTLIERTARANGCQVPGVVKLRITLDSTGKITNVTVLSGNSTVGKLFIHQLTGATSATLAVGQGPGILEVTLTTSSR
jgi:hypothetical protein